MGPDSLAIDRLSNLLTMPIWDAYMCYQLLHMYYFLQLYMTSCSKKQWRTPCKMPCHRHPSQREDILNKFWFVRHALLQILLTSNLAPGMSLCIHYYDISIKVCKSACYIISIICVFDQKECVLFIARCPDIIVQLSWFRLSHSDFMG